MGYIYLGSPYTHSDPAVRLTRFEAAVRAAARLMREGRAVFSPIAHSHAIGQALNRPTDHAFWMKQDLPILRCASEMYVLMLDGWDGSRGLGEEVEVATACLIQIVYLPREYADH